MLTKANPNPNPNPNHNHNPNQVAPRFHADEGAIPSMAMEAEAEPSLLPVALDLL